MTEQEIKYLTDTVGLSEEAARLRLRDEDLWLLRPDGRFDEELVGEEGVRAWEEAVTLAHAIGNMVSNGPGTIQANPAITQLVWDADARAQEALRRARERSRRVTILKEAVVQLDAAAEDRREEGSPEIARRIEEVITFFEDELEEITGKEIPRPVRSEAEEDHDIPGERRILSVVNGLLARATDLLSESFAPTEAEAEAERQARHSIAEAGMIVARLLRHHEAELLSGQEVQPEGAKEPAS